MWLAAAVFVKVLSSQCDRTSGGGADAVGSVEAGHVPGARESEAVRLLRVVGRRRQTGRQGPPRHHHVPGLSVVGIIAVSKSLFPTAYPGLFNGAQ